MVVSTPRRSGVNFSNISFASVGVLGKTLARGDGDAGDDEEEEEEEEEEEGVDDEACPVSPLFKIRWMRSAFSPWVGSLRSAQSFRSSPTFIW